MGKFHNYEKKTPHLRPYYTWKTTLYLNVSKFIYLKVSGWPWQSNAMCDSWLDTRLSISWAWWLYCGCGEDWLFLRTRAFEESWLLQLTGQGFERSEKQTKVNRQSVRNWWIWGKDAACLLCHTSNSLEIWKKIILSWKKSFLRLTIEQFTKEKRKKFCMCTFEMFDYMNKK